MARTYNLKKRAQQQAATRRRIVEAAVELHGTVGPAATTLSMIAARAGVQRHTLYAHFPDQRGLFLACSELAITRDPMPDAAAWHAIADPCERLTAGLLEVYAWYERNASLIACVLRDAEHHALTREVHEGRSGAAVAAWHEALGAELTATQRAILKLALSFFTWRTLARDGGLDRRAAVAVMVRAIEHADVA